MEPGQRDREQGANVTFGEWSAAPQWSPVNVTGNRPVSSSIPAVTRLPQWSPVNVTGNSWATRPRVPRAIQAAMEPGQRDREQNQPGAGRAGTGVAAMEPGQRDR